jgi:hypothetical protein
MKEIDAHAHEAGHALAGYYFGVPIKTVSVYSSDGEAGRCRFESGAVGSELVAATILVCGRMAEKRALGDREAFNWLDDDDTDTRNAVDMVDAIVEAGGFDGDVFEARHWVELKTRSLLATKWAAVEALASKLRKSHVLMGDVVVKICRAAGVRRQSEGRSISRDEALSKLSPKGRRALMGEVTADGKTRIKR